MLKNKNFFNLPGFTLIEIVVVISIVLLVVSIGFLSLVNSRNVRNVVSSGQTVLSVLQFAQSRSLGGEDNSAWGVRLEQTRVVLFRGTVYVTSTATTSYSLDPGIELVSAVLNGGGQDVLFKRLTGETDQYGTLTLRVVNAPTVTFPITIERSGKVFRNAAAPAFTSSRIVDARHRTFNLGWSIQNSILLTLTFANSPLPDVNFPVVMAGYFDAMKTKFDWSGTVPIGLENQTLRIHTTFLDGANTIFSVDRDCRRNTKRLTIVIDGKTIATYEADCRTVTVGAFGGTMSEP